MLDSVIKAKKKYYPQKSVSETESDIDNDESNE